MCIIVKSGLQVCSISLCYYLTNILSILGDRGRSDSIPCRRSDIFTSYGDIFREISSELLMQLKGQRKICDKI